ncbi:hypothetical protein FW774_16535 [Pedobacter sp. BS3]|uniref:hypothetical protein n=1 Tax=Pedobacter sp. BS3 TaxID=2567937 RepID=UPI0011EFD475|nr:hypothetical protein [Pedobacter sp. BS3]TZF82291.1 hypothetical protein FW774_16535 [Pedobacter sp. BS3]
MKLLNIILALLIANNLWAQNKKTEIKAERNVYIYNSPEDGRYKSTGPNKLISVYRKNSIPMAYDKALNLSRLSNVAYATQKPITQSVMEVFSRGRLSELMQEKPLLVNMYINDKGKIIAIKYFINANSQITPVELEKLEDALKKNVSVTFVKDEDNKDLMWPISQTISFDKILNKTYRY